MEVFTHEYVLFQITWFETKIGTHLTHIETHTHIICTHPLYTLVVQW